MIKADRKVMELDDDDLDVCVGGSVAMFTDIVWLGGANDGGTEAAREVVVVGSKVKDVVRTAGL